MPCAYLFERIANEINSLTRVVQKVLQIYLLIYFIFPSHLSLFPPQPAKARACGNLGNAYSALGEFSEVRRTRTIIIMITTITTTTTRTRKTRKTRKTRNKKN